MIVLRIILVIMVINIKLQFNCSPNDTSKHNNDNNDSKSNSSSHNNDNNIVRVNA